VGTLWRAAYVALGSNLSQPKERVEEALAKLAALPLRAFARSRLFGSKPMGPQQQPDYVNAAAAFLTQQDAHELLKQLLAIEQAMGRIRAERWGPRIIDLDLIHVTGLRVEAAGLTIPHPGVSSRNFVLYPLSDIAPTLEIPGVGNVQQLLERVGREGIEVLS
jgi:2-amino-4-hydroxy-6-hydroxymethyldihydropteridine diphosphokinase